MSVLVVNPFASPFSIPHPINRVIASGGAALIADVARPCDLETLVPGIGASGVAISQVAHTDGPAHAPSFVFATRFGIEVSHEPGANPRFALRTDVPGARLEVFDGILVVRLHLPIAVPRARRLETRSLAIDPGTFLAPLAPAIVGILGGDEEDATYDFGILLSRDAAPDGSPPGRAVVEYALHAR